MVCPRSVAQCSPEALAERSAFVLLHGRPAPPIEDDLRPHVSTARSQPPTSRIAYGSTVRRRTDKSRRCSHAAADGLKIDLIVASLASPLRNGSQRRMRRVASP